MQDSHTWELSSLEDTNHMGWCLAKSLKGTENIFIYGNLGTGKTSLCRAVISSMGYKGRIKSPTYTIIENYDINGFCINHLDLYRIVDAEELFFSGITEQLITGVSLIEWPDNGTDVLKKPDAKIYMNYKDNCRSIHIVSSSSIGANLLRSIRSLVNLKD
jgi:tRNA threonylcarbamoyladenosine biosynthesis protein TsaE